MVRNLGGIAVGLLVAIVIIMAAEAIGHRLFAGGLAPDGGAPPAMALPPEVNASVLAGWFLGALAGGYAAILVSRIKSMAWAVAMVILLAVGFRFAIADAPAWMIAGGLVAPPLAAWIAQRLPVRRRSAAA